MDEQITKLLNKSFTLAAILVLGVLVFFVGQLALQNKSLSLQNANQITVSGEGKAYAKPDVAIVSFGVTTSAKTVADVTSKNTTQMNAVIAAVKKLGVADVDIQTTNYSLNPVYNTKTVYIPESVGIMGIGTYVPPSSTVVSSTPTLTGYTLEQDVQIKIRDFTKVGDVLSVATTSGANVVGNLQFTIDNPEQFKEQARAKAIAQAKANAQNLAKESGVGLGKLINVYENSNPYPVVYNSMAKDIAVGGGVSAPVAPTVQPGQQEIDVTINLTYQVK